MRTDDYSQDFEIDEPADEEIPLNSSYGGEIEVGEPFKIGLHGISNKPCVSPEEMRQILTHWLLKRFDLCIGIGVITFILLKEVGVLIALLSGTGLFAILFLLVYKYYFTKKE